MKQWHWFGLGILALTLAVVFAAMPQLGGGSREASAQGGLTIALDMDTGGGPCADIDSSTSHHGEPGAGGDTYTIGVCVSGLYEGFPIGVVSFDVIYNDILNTAPEVANSGNALDDNPDANAGSTTWGSSLGTGFDCSGGGLAFPKGDKDPATGAGHGDAFLSCKSATGPWTLGDNETSGVLAVITFHANAAGTDNLRITNGLLGYSDATEMGTCNPTVTYEMDCNGGSDVKTGATAPSPTPTSTPSATATPCPNGICPTSTPTARALTATPAFTATATAAPGETTQPPAPPPPAPPSGGEQPQVTPPGTGSGPDGFPWNTALAALMAAIGAISITVGGLGLRRARHR